MRKSIIFSFLLFLTLICHAQTNLLSIRLDSIVTRYFIDKEFMGSVLVAQNGNLLLDKAYGYSDIEKGIPNTTTTHYHIASITKLFTLDAIRVLEDRGRIKRDDPVSKYIDDFPNGDKITIKHLFQNKSGLVDYLNETPYIMGTEEKNIIELFDKCLATDL